jgi:hypothetical protein
MDASDLARIESALGVTLPADYRAFLQRPRTDDDAVDETSVFADADTIIAATRDYRAGFAGLPPWPHHLVYVGDESDACPYAIDCVSGKLIRTDKGAFGNAPLAEYASFAAFHRHFEEQARTPVDPRTLGWRQRYYYAPAVIGVLVFLVVLPAVGIGASLLIAWLRR